MAALVKYNKYRQEFEASIQHTHLVRAIDDDLKPHTTETISNVLQRNANTDVPDWRKRSGRLVV
jgi:hypothetical protein